MSKYPNRPKEWRDMPVLITEDDLLIGGWQVMQTWEQPIMELMAEEITSSGGDILEIGFGMGISASEITKRKCKSYTVIEAHPVIVKYAKRWAQFQEVEINIIEGFWQDIIPKINKKYDGILFDTYPLTPDERSKNHFSFIPVAPRLLNQNGLFTYYSDENINFRPEHLKLLLKNFDSIKLLKVNNLEPPNTCEYWSDSCMVIPVASKPILY